MTDEKWKDLYCEGIEVGRNIERKLKIKERYIPKYVWIILAISAFANIVGIVTDGACK